MTILPTSQNQDLILLDDEPVECSAFEWHGRLATAIEDLIRCEDRGRIVGLFGSWGSGKSSVISILKSALTSTANIAANNIHEVFIFDAWSHSHDPLRRSFFEELTAFYIQRGYTTPDAWEEDTNKLSRRQEEATIHSTPVVKPWGAFLALLYAGSVIFGGQFAASFVKGYFVETNSDVDNLPYSLFINFANSMGLYHSPWIYLALAAFCFLWPLLIFPIAKNVGANFIAKTQETTKTRTIKSIDPTTIEFLDVFGRLISLCQRKKAHKLLIVVDNLDRLPDEEILTLWATIRSFFSLKKDKEKVWVLVPFDPTALRRIFIGETSGQNAEATLNSFVDKTFEAKFWVVPPVLADSQNYFRQQAQKIFGSDLSDQASAEIFHIYEAGRISSLENSEGQNTPRRIKTFINELRLMKHLWGEKIPLKTLAVYISVRSRISNDLRTFITQTNANPTAGLNHQQIFSMDGENWQKNFAAIYYGVEPEKAIQVLVHDKIVSALANGSADTDFLEMSKIDGFMPVLQRAIQQQAYSWASDFNILSTYTSCLMALEKSGAQKLQAIWKFMMQGLASGIDVTGKLETNSPEIIAYLMDRAIEFNKQKFIDSVFESMMLLPMGEERNVEYAGLVAATLRSACKALGNSNSQLPASAMTRIAPHLPLEMFWAVADKCKNAQETYPIVKALATSGDFFSPAPPRIYPTTKLCTASISNAVETLDSAGYTGTFVKAIEYFDGIARSLKIENGIEEALHSLNLFSSHMHFLQCQPEKRIRGLFNDGIIYILLNSAQVTKNETVKALCICLILAWDLSGSNTQSGNPEATSGFNLRQKILQAPISQDSFGDKLKELILKYFNLRQFIDAVADHGHYFSFSQGGFQALLQGDGSFIESSDIIGSFSKTEKFLVEVEVEAKFLEKSVAQTDFWPALEAFQALNENIVDLCSRLIRRDIARQMALDYLYKKISSLSGDDWVNSLDTGVSSSELKAVQLLSQHSYPQVYGADLGNAFLNKIGTMAGKNEEDQVAFRLLPKTLSSSEKTFLERRLTTGLSKLEADQIETRLSFMPELYCNFEGIQNHEDEFFSKVIIPLIESRSQSGLNWIKASSYPLRGLLDNVSPSIKAPLEERLLDAQDQIMGDMNDAIKAIALAWDIKPKATNENKAPPTEEAG